MKTIRLLLLFAVVAAIPAHASVSELVPNLASTNLVDRFQAQKDLLREASHAGRPSAEAERAAYCGDLCLALSDDCPPVVAVQLVRQLQRIGGDESVDTLSGLLQHPDANLRDDVRQALEANPSPRAGKVLLDAWKQSDDDTWTLALINALGQRGDERAVTPLAKALLLPNPRIASAAASALGRIPHQSAATALHRALTPARPDVAAGLLAFAHLSAQQGNGSLAARLYRSLTQEKQPADVRTSAWIGLLTAMPEKAAELATPLSDPVILVAAIDASTQVKAPALTERIAGQLATARPDVQLRILTALEANGDSKYAAEVASLLASENQDVAGAAIQTLGVIGTPAEMTALMENDRGIEALARIADSDIDTALALHAAKGGTEERVRAIKIMGLRGAQGLSSQLMAYARDPDPKVSAAALAALENVATVDELAAVTELMLKTESSSLARGALGTVIAINRNTSQPERAAQVLIDQLPNADARGQALVFQAFTKIGSDVTLALVLAAADSEDSAQHAAGLKALTSWPESNAVNPLLAAARDESLEMKDHVLVMRGLARLLDEGKKTRLDRCAQALQAARRPEEKKMLLGVLGKTKNRKALDLIQPYLADPELAEEAELAIAAISPKSSR